jgi:hypothetical protein
MESPRADARPRPSVLAAWIDGWRRVFRAPVLVLGLAVVWVLTWDVDWPSRYFANWVTWIFGNDAFAFGGPLDLMSRLSGGYAIRRLVYGGVPELVPFTTDVLVVLFLTGGAIDRLARDRRIGTAAFFAASGSAFMRFLRMSVILGSANWLLLHVVIPRAIDALPQVDPAAGFWQPRALVGGVGFVAVLALAIVGDYARVRTVVEDRRSAIGSISAAIRFVWRRPVHVLIIWSLNFAMAGIVLALVGALGIPNGGPTLSLPGSMQVVLGIVLVVLAPLVQSLSRLGFIGTSVAFFQNELAHAGYTAAPVPTWPDSPAVEAVANMEARQRDDRAGRALPL